MSIWSKISFACLQAIAFIVKFVFIKHHTPWFRSAGGRAVSTRIGGTSLPLQLTDRLHIFYLGADRFSVILLFYPLPFGATGSGSKHAYKHNNMDSTYLSMLAFLNTFQVLLQGERATLGLSLGFVKLVKLRPWRPWKGSGSVSKNQACYKLGIYPDFDRILVIKHNCLSSVLLIRGMS